MILLSALAFADPDVLRHPTDGLAVSVGSAGVSAVGWGGAHGLGAGYDGVALSVFGAARSPKAPLWGAGAAIGLTVPLADLGVAVEGVGWFGPETHGRWGDAALHLVAPAAVSITDGVARVGVRLEPRLGVHFGAWSVSASGGLGVLQSTDSGWAMDLRAGLALGWQRETP